MAQVPPIFIVHLYMDQFIRTLSSYATIPREEAERFYSIFRVEKYKKNTLLLSAGKVSHEVFLVQKGGLRQFFTNEKGTVKTCNFTFEGEFVTDLESFANKTLSTTNIIALEPTECLVVSCQDLTRYLSNSPSVTVFFNSLVEKTAMVNIRRIQSLISLSPEEQLGELLQERPQLLQRVPQRYVAEYLGVAPESLSRIRKRILTSPKS
ncbi:Crp/Fnr family transcriptional regulator [Chryseobacterium sp. A301]